MEVNVLGRAIPVRFISDKEIEKIGEDKNLLGLFDRGTIYIATSVPQEEVKRVIFHELSHAVLEISGLHNLFTNEQQEAICDAFETYLDVVRSDDLVKLLNAGESE